MPGRRRAKEGIKNGWLVKRIRLYNVRFGK